MNSLICYFYDYIYLYSTKCDFCEEAVAHEFGTVKRVKEATETEHGEDLYTCNQCGKTKTKILHYEIHTSNEKEATCPVHGYVGEVKCSVCKILLQGNRRTKLTTEKEATCTEDGYHWPWVCTVQDEKGSSCKQVLSGVIQATGHKYDKYVDNGKTHSKVCSVCGEVEEGSEVEHTWNKGIITKPASADAHGSITYTCDVCKLTKTEVIHSFEYATEFVDDENNNGHRAVCPVDGCDELDSKIIAHSYEGAKDFVPDAEGHHPVCTANGCTHADETETIEHKWDLEGFSKGKITTQPTATEHGERTYTCEICGYNEKKEVVHSFAFATTYVVDEKNDGYHRAVCPVDGCDAVSSVNEGHDYDVYSNNESEATCPKHGYVGEIKCSKCGEVVRKDQRKRDWKGKQATCTEPGYTLGAYLCNWNGDCGEILSGRLEPTGHTSSNTWEHTGNEDDEYYHVKKCTVCEEELEKVKVTFNNPPENCAYKVEGNKHAVPCSKFDECHEYSELVEHSYPEYRSVDETKDPDADDAQKFVKECICGHKIYKNSLTDALNDAKNTTTKTVVINNEFKVNSNNGTITIPKDVTLHITENGKITCGNSVSSYTIKNNGTLTVDKQENIDSKIKIENGTNASVKETVISEEKLKKALEIDKGKVEITLEENISFTDSCIQVKNGSNVTMDLNGKTIERTEATPTDQNSVSCVGIYNNGGTLTIKGGTIKDSTTNSNGCATSAIANLSDGNLTLEDVTIEGNSYGIQNFGNLKIKGGTKIDAKAYGIAMVEGSKKLEIEGTDEKHVSISSQGLGISTRNGEEDVTITAKYVDIESESTAIYLPATGTYSFTNCDIKGKGGIDALAGTITLENTKVTATGTHVDNEQLATNGQAGGDGSAILLRSKNPYGSTNRTLTLNISGNSILTASGENCKKLRVYIGSTPGVNNITITTKNNDTDLIGTDYEINENEGKEVTVTLNGSTISNHK